MTTEAVTADDLVDILTEKPTVFDATAIAPGVVACIRDGSDQDTNTMTFSKTADWDVGLYNRQETGDLVVFVRDYR